MKFKVLEFIRKTRDENYEKNKNLNSKDKKENKYVYGLPCSISDTL